MGIDDLLAAGVPVLGNDSPITDSVLNAVRYAESKGNPFAVSPAGAQGAYQFMPATAQEIRQEMGLTTPYDYTNEAEQRQMAKYYLEKNYKDLGDLDQTLAAYNAGPGAVQKYGGIPPYKETQGYVTKVNNYIQNPELIAPPTTTSQPIARKSSIDDLLQQGIPVLGGQATATPSKAPVAGSGDGPSGLSMLLRGDFSGYMDKAYSPEAQRTKETGIKEIQIGDRVLDVNKLQGLIGAAAENVGFGAGSFFDEAVGLISPEARDNLRENVARVSEENPVVSSLMRVGGGLVGGLGAARSVPQAMALGGLGGAVHGVGTGEGAKNRAVRGVGEAVTGALLSGLFQGVGQAGTKRALSKRALNQDKKSLGFTIPKEAKIQKRAGGGLSSSAPSRVDMAVETLRDPKNSKVFSGLGKISPKHLADNMQTKLDDNFNAVDSLFTAAKKASKQKLKPKFTIAKRFAREQGGTGEVKGLLKKIDDIAEEIGKGKDIKGLLRLKRKIGAMAYDKNPLLVPQLKRKMYADVDHLIKKELKRLIKNNDLPANTLEKWSQLNKETSAIMTLQEVMEEHLVKLSKMSTAEKLIPSYRTSGGLGVLSLLSGLTSGSVPLALLPPALYAGATTSTARLARSSLNRELAKVAPETIGGVPAIVQGLIAQATSKNPKEK